MRAPLSETPQSPTAATAARAAANPTAANPTRAAPAAANPTAANPTAANSTMAAPAARRSAHRRDALALRLQREHGNRRARAIIQAKLRVGPAGDRYEREADRVADLAARPSAPGAPARIHQVHGGPGGAADPAVARAVARARSGGRPVPAAVRERMERVSGADLGAVRVHVDAESDRLNGALGSRAFTVGADVFVRRGEYRPGSARGDALLAHELTHTVQQRAVPGAGSAPAPATPVAQRQPDDGSSAFNKGWDALLRLLRIRGAADPDRQVPDPDAQLTFSQERGSAYAQAHGLTPMQDRLLNLGGPGLADDSVQVAHKIHFIWLGDRRPLDGTEQSNIGNWLAKADEADWEVHLWTDEASRKTNDGFLKQVGAALAVHDVGELVGQPAAGALQGALDRGAYTQASDILRLMLLLAEGGIYLDVDMEPGGAALPEDLAMDPEGIPFLGPNIQNKQGVETTLAADKSFAKLRRRYYRQAEKTVLYYLKAPFRAVGKFLSSCLSGGTEQQPREPDLAGILADYAELTLAEKVSFGNGFIIAAQDMPFLGLLLNRIVEFDQANVAPVGEDFVSKLAQKAVNNDTVDVTGYRLIQEEILKLLGASEIRTFVTWPAAVRQGLVAYNADRVEQWKKMGWLTSASNKA